MSNLRTISHLEYPEYQQSYQESHRDPYSYHPRESHLEPPLHRQSRISHSQASTRSWVYASQQNPPGPPPSEPMLGVSSPLARSYGVPDSYGIPEYEEPADVEEEEYMNINPDGPDLETRVPLEPERMASPVYSIPKEGGKNFIGGFIGSLKKIPKAMRRKGNKRDKSDWNGADLTNGARPSNFPMYPANAEAGPSGIQYAEPFEMPVDDPRNIPLQRSASPASYREQNFDHEQTPLASNQLVSDAPNITRTSPSVATERLHPTRAVTTPSSDESDDIYAPHTPPTENVTSQEMHDGETTVVHHEVLPPGVGVIGELGGIDSPVLAHPAAAPDYAKMDSPIRAPSERSLSSQFDLLHKFFKDIRDLPWVSTQIAAEYVPGQRNRRKHALAQEKPPASWYNSQHHNVNLLAGELSPRPPVLFQRRYMGGSSATLAYPLHVANPDLQRPRHARSNTEDSLRNPRSALSARSEGQYPVYPHGYAPYGYNYAPQPFYVMRSPTPPGSANGRVGSAGGRVGNPDMAGYPDMVPVYMVPHPHGGFVPPPGQINEPVGHVVETSSSTATNTHANAPQETGLTHV